MSQIKMGLCSDLLLTLLMPVLVLTMQSCGETVNEKSSKTPGTVSKLPSDKREIYIDLKKVLSNGDKNKMEDVTVKYDHFFKTTKKFRGYYINTIIDSVIHAENFDTTQAIIIFECVDGYKPVMELSKLYGNTRGFIAFKDLDPGVTNNWPDSVAEIFKPYYLIWDDVKKEDNSFMWPFGLVGLRIGSKDWEYKGIYPYKDSSLVTGFKLFRENCIKCHSLNKTGGTMGPEFNFPKNITEYWKEEDILSFAKDPSSFRYNSRMPSITNVTGADLKEIIRYIKSMKNNH